MTMSMTSPNQGRLEELEAALEDVRASRPAASRVVAMTNDPRCDAGDIAAVIDTDPLLTTQILRLANSAAYGMSERVGNTQVAVSLVGFSGDGAFGIAVTELTAIGRKKAKAAVLSSDEYLLKCQTPR